MQEALEIRVKGIVQGVGFRPFVYTMAQKHSITGWVLNQTQGVLIHAEGSSENLDAFIMEINNNAPKAAQVKEINMAEVELEGFTGFEIRQSLDQTAQATTLVSPDLATCDECAAELFDPTNRRYRYPFINCTNCGPRFTIIKNLPYDRAQTTMEPFAMCPECAQEYENPADRRFHAQPDACFECGPQLGWITSEDYKQAADSPITWATNRETSDEILAQAVAFLNEGKILAVKGLGGFHLVCDANNEAALANLRARKKRSNKGFAVMAATVEQAKQVCFVSAEEEQQLRLPSTPIVLLKKKPEAQFATGLADGLPELGVMLPSTPVQHLLAHDFGGLLVMTSANIHDEPIVIDNGEALSKLSNVADAFVLNNRDIEVRFDDSVLRVLDIPRVGGVVQMIRRARGFAPMPVALPACGAANMAAGQGSCEGELAQTSCEGEQAEGAAASQASNTLLFATGPEQKNTFCYVRGDAQASVNGTACDADSAAQAGASNASQTSANNNPPLAFVSQHIGDMENAETYDAWLNAKDTYSNLFRLDALLAVIAADYHPEYLTSKWAESTSHPALVKVQHHHAHIAAVLGENNLDTAVCGIAFDGTGYGLDGSIWGGEVLLANQQDYERFANFAYFPLPGGAASIKNPLRCAYGLLWANDLLEHPEAQKIFAEANENTQLLEQMIEKGINTPMTSSVGRIFDAASALLGICPQPTYEGEAAIMLEAAVHEYLAGQGAAAGKDACEGATKAADASQAEGTGQRVSATQTPDALITQARQNPYTITAIKNVATKESTAHDTSVLLFDVSSLFDGLLTDLEHGVEIGLIALKFHESFVAAIVQAAQFVRALYDIDIVALSGGVFMNRYLMENAVSQLQLNGFTVALNKELPPNDASISYGQAVVALQSMSKE
ncbi:MAG: carbamoyltransferase HypF [Anaerotardibacter sp.]